MVLKCVMTFDENMRKKVEKLLEFAEFAVRTLELYGEISSTVAREMLLAELRHRLRTLNGARETGAFTADLSLLTQMINEITRQPADTAAVLECAEQLSIDIEQALLGEKPAGQTGRNTP